MHAFLLLAQPVVAAARQPLFEDPGPLPVTLSLSMGDLRARRSGDELFRGVIAYGEAGAKRRFEVEINVRGHSRRELCDMPPLKLNFRRSEVAGSLFENQNKLKLVTHCQRGRRFRRYLQQEYATYGAYGALTDASFRVRRLDVTYVDTDGRKRDIEAPAFLLEDDGRVADRLGFDELGQPVAPTASLAPDVMTVFGLFQFMIGNTDWSLLKGRGDDDCCHNGLLLRRPDDLLVIVPYDFDQAGIIDAHYALPAEGLGILSVRQRVYRGLCTGSERLERAVTLFNARRERIEAQFPVSGGSGRENRRARRYIDEFFEIINDDASRARWIEEPCRGDPSFWDWLETEATPNPSAGGAATAR